METRQLEASELENAFELVWRTFLEFEAPDYEAKGVETFRACLEDKDFVGRLTVYGAYDGGALIGVAATRNDGNHLAMFFVRRDHHRRGVGRQLFEHIKPLASSDRITINSSPYAVGVYRRLGFKETDSEKQSDGLRFTPMEYKIR